MGSLKEADWRQQLTEIVDHVAAGIVVLNPEGLVVFANPGAAKIFGMTRGAMIGKYYDTVTSNIVTFEDETFPPERRAFNLIVKDLKPVQGVEYKVRRAGGVDVFVTVNASPILDRDGELMAVVVSVMDITAGKTGENALRTSEEQRFQTVADNAVDAIITADAAGKISFWNYAAEKMFGYTSHEVVGRDITKIMPAHYRPIHKAGLARFLATGKPHMTGTIAELEGLRADGTVFPLESSLASWKSDGQRHFTATIRDISEDRKVEEEMSLLAAIVESSADAIISETRDGTILSWNPEAEKIYGYTEDEIKGRSIAVLLPADDRDELARFMQIIRSGERVSHYRTVHRRKDAGLISICYVVSPVKKADGKIIGASMIAHHIKERRASPMAADA